MKINWGTGIVICFVAFISFILFFVVRMSTQKEYAHDLVTKEYYKAELAYQKEIDSEKNSFSLSENIQTKITPDGLLLIFPKTIKDNEIKGKIFLYRPSNKLLDFDTVLSISNSQMLIPKKRLLEGRWDIKIFWNYQDQEYLFKESLHYK
ncbi:FixH family protein [Aquimarina rhabdastrellae]